MVMATVCLRKCFDGDAGSQKKPPGEGEEGCKEETRMEMEIERVTRCPMLCRAENAARRSQVEMEALQGMTQA